MLRILKTNKFLSLMNFGVMALLGLVTYSLIIRVTTKEEFGIWAIFTTVLTFFYMLRSGLLSNAVIKNVTEAQTEERLKQVVGSGWTLNLRVTLIGAILVNLVLLGIYLYNGEEVYGEMAKWFAVTAIIDMPTSMAIWTLNAKMQFGKMLVVNIFSKVLFFVGIVILYFTGAELADVFMLYFFSGLSSAIVVMIAGWSGLKHLAHSTKDEVKRLFNFGKFSMGTLIGSNLLKSSDTFIITFFLGPEAVAIYNVPEKLLALIEIPLRSIISIAYPQLIKKKKEGSKEGFINEFEIGAGFSTILLLPVTIAMIIFAEPLVVLLAGEDYASSANILRVFAIYTALTPIDRFCGITLDAFDRPQRNMHKVFIMLGINVVGDLLVLYLWGDVMWVALISTFSFLAGVIFGFRFLSDIVPFRLHLIFGKGYLEILRLTKKYLKLT